MNHRLHTLALLIAIQTCATAAPVETSAPPAQDTSPAAAPSLEALAADSSNWPFRVALKTDQLAPEARHGVTGLAPGVLLRVEGHEAVLDFGREGIHRFPLEVTDFRERALEEQAGASDKDLPNFIRYTTNAFARVDREGKRSNIPVDTMADLKHFLIAYADQRLLEDESVLAAYREATLAIEDAGLWTLMFPTDITLLVRVKDHDLPRIFPLPHMVEPMVRMLHHQPGDQPKFVLVDAEGKILDTWEMPYAEFPDQLPKMQASVLKLIEASE